MVFDQKWWLHAYIGKTTYDLCIYYIYIYVYFERIQYSSLFSGNLFPYLSQVMPWIDLPIGTPFLKFTQESAGGFYGVSLKNPARERMVLLDLGHFGVSAPGVPKCEFPCTRKSRNPDS
jgi:hypothetical protein